MEIRRLNWQLVTDRKYMMIGTIDTMYSLIYFLVFRKSQAGRIYYWVKSNLKGLPSLTCYCLEDVIDGAELILSKFIHSLIQP